MKWTVVKASASLSIKQSRGDDLFSQIEQGLCSVCILYVFWWSCGPYQGVTWNHNNNQSGEKSSWRLRIVTSDSHYILLCFFFLYDIHTVSRVFFMSFHFLIHILFIFPCWPPLSSSVRIFHNLSLPSHFALLFSYFPIIPCTLPSIPSVPLSSLEPNQESSLLLFPDAGGRGGRGGGWERSSSEGVFVVKLTCAVFTKRMSPGRDLPRLNGMHDTLICHALACMSTPAKTLSWLPSQLSPYSLST